MNDVEPASAAVENELGRIAAGDADGQERHDGLRLGFLIHDVSRLRRHAFDHLIKPYGATRAQWWVLAHLSRHDGMMQSQLADMLDVGKASLGTVLERLEQNKLIERRADPSDRRARRVFLTKHAARLLDDMGAVENDFNDRLLADLDGDDVTTLIRLLQELKGRLAKF